MTNNSPGDDAALQLQDLLLGTENVEDFLDQLAVFAAATLSRLIGAEVECGVTLQRRKRTMTVAGSSPRAVVLDRIEQRFGDGPCTEALRTKSVVLLPDVHADPRWPAYQLQLAGHGCRSTLGVPLEIGEDADAALNFFGSDTGLFTGEIIKEAAGFADLAGRSLRLAVRIGTARTRAEDLQAAMEHRTSIDLACGVVMAQNRCTQNEAMAILTKVSSNRNQKLRDVAADLLRNITNGEVRTHFEA
ncbi:GAF domain-containing protein [Arthrobacter sp. V4I6]|uniref:GAF and ANTAR domain-containing protein n=1 Tax=unclassified Arthrobacter TaxID=235627 RepID=UPI0027890E55|nr:MULTISPECIES: GAF and ANTAR domain-containing protein [unclassified Arthrobacter]MDQ0819802.1 GAF domain-containing protein [Arthrobacter sp. V1I7]MDQ0853981.1 GAF domain-containing protein [Arthrobacter sp. V4I6]